MEGYTEYLWDLTDWSMESNSEWWPGQVSINAHKLVLEVVHGANGSDTGYVALGSSQLSQSSRQA